MITTEIPKQSCPSCGFTANGAFGLGKVAGKPPQPGKIGVCSVCAEVFMFDEDLKLVKIPADMEEQIRQNRSVIAAQMMVRLHNQSKMDDSDVGHA